MNGDIVFKSARLVLCNEIVDGTLAVAGGLIVGLDSGSSGIAAAEDAEGDYLLPGLVELHTDNFERHLMPRPKVRWPEMPALYAHDAEIAAAGITTVYDAIGIGDPDPEALRSQHLSPIFAALDRAAADGVLRAEHRLHLRCELPAANTLELFEPFKGHPSVGLISLMDHTPGQRQWEDIAQARIYFCGKKGWSDAKFDARVSQSLELQQRYVRPHRSEISVYARSRGIALASHDDTTADQVHQAHREGAAISEFPTRLEAASAARAHGMATVMGAPNVVRGGSHSGNVSAIELARAGLLDVLSSDYVPASLLMGVFRLVDDAGYTLPQAVATVSRNPARAVHLDDRGEIALGMRADLTQVRLVRGANGRAQPVVRAVWREGRRVV